MVASLVIALGVYILLLFIISYYLSRKQTEEDFLISGRNRGWLQILTSKFSATIGAGYFITYAGFAYEFGINVFTLVIGLVVGSLIFGYWAAPKIHRPSKAGKFYTMGDFVQHNLKNRTTKKITDFFSSLILFGWVMVGIVAGAKIIADFNILSYAPAVIVTSLVVLGYLLLAGHRAVLATDLIQSIVIVVLLFAITIGIAGAESISSILSTQTGGIDIATALGFFLFGIFGAFSISDRYQLCYAAKNEKHLKHGISMMVIPMLIVASLLLIIGMFMASKMPGLDPGLIFTEALKNFLPASLLPFAIVLFFAGIMSSADTSIYAIASHFALYHKGNPVKLIKKSIIGLTAIIMFLALIWSDVVDISIVAGLMTMLLSLPMIYVLFDGKNVSRFIFSVIGGVIGFIAGLVIFGIAPAGILTILIGSGIGLLFRRKR